MASTTYQLVSRISSISSIADTCLMTSNSNSQRAFSPTFPHSPSIPSFSNRWEKPIRDRVIHSWSTHPHPKHPHQGAIFFHSEVAFQWKCIHPIARRHKFCLICCLDFYARKWWWICYGFGRFAYNKLEALMCITRFQQILRFDEMKHDEPYLYL